jgi:MFS superfamily sulfate permease-like transporter
MEQEVREILSRALTPIRDQPAFAQRIQQRFSALGLDAIPGEFPAAKLSGGQKTRLALAGVLFIDVLQGMMIGLLASLAFVVYRSSRPHLSSLGRVPGVAGAYMDLARHPDSVPVPGVLIVRLDAPMYYANALTARDRLKAMIHEAAPLPTAVIFDGEGQDDLDFTSAHMLIGLVTEFRGRGLEVCFANVHGPVLGRARETGLLEAVGGDRDFPTVDQAVRALEQHASASGDKDRAGGRS